MSGRIKRARGSVAALLLGAAVGCGSAEGGESAEAEQRAGTDASARVYESAEVADYDAPEYPDALLVPAGTTLRVRLGSELNTSDNKVGDRITASVARPIRIDGATAIPAGAQVSGQVTAVQRAEGERPAVIKLDFDRLRVASETYPLIAEVIDAEPEMRSETSTGEDAAKIGVGTAAGAIIGRVIGGNSTGTLVGAAVGAAAGTAIVLGTQDEVAVLPAGSSLTLRVEESMRLDVP